MGQPCGYNEAHLVDTDLQQVLLCLQGLASSQGSELSHTVQRLQNFCCLFEKGSGLRDATLGQVPQNIFALPHVLNAQS